MSLWTEASRDVEGENALRRFTAAKLSVAGLWPFLAAAGRDDFENRLALVADRLETAIPEDDVREEVIASLREDFATLDEARTRERITAETVRRKAARKTAGEVPPEFKEQKEKVEDPDKESPPGFPEETNKDDDDKDEDEDSGKPWEKASTKEAAQKVPCGSCKGREPAKSTCGTCQGAGFFLVNNTKPQLASRQEPPPFSGEGQEGGEKTSGFIAKVKAAARKLFLEEEVPRRLDAAMKTTAEFPWQKPDAEATSEDKAKEGEEKPPAEGEAPAAGGDDIGALTPGAPATLHYKLADGTEGDAQVTLDANDGTTATFSYDKGTFILTKDGNVWKDPLGTEFSIGAAPAAAPGAPAPPAAPAAEKPAEDKPKGEVPEQFKKKESSRPCNHPQATLVESKGLGGFDPIGVYECDTCGVRFELPITREPWEDDEGYQSSKTAGWVDDLDKDIFSGGIDNVTKGMLTSVMEALSPANREKFAALPLEQAVTVGWNLVSGRGAKVAARKCNVDTCDNNVEDERWTTCPKHWALGTHVNGAKLANEYLPSGNPYAVDQNAGPTPQAPGPGGVGGAPGTGGAPQTTKPRQMPAGTPQTPQDPMMGAPATPVPPPGATPQPQPAQPPRATSALNTELPIQCEACGRKITAKLSTIAAGLTCVCGSEDYDIDDSIEATAADDLAGKTDAQLVALYKSKMEEARNLPEGENTPDFTKLTKEIIRRGIDLNKLSATADFEGLNLGGAGPMASLRALITHLLRGDKKIPDWFPKSYLTEEEKVTGRWSTTIGGGGDPQFAFGSLDQRFAEWSQNNTGPLHDVPAVREDFRCSRCFHEFVDIARDPAQAFPPCPNCGSDATTAAGANVAVTRPKMSRKVEQITAGILATNPGMAREAAVKLAEETVRRYPKVAAS